MPASPRSHIDSTVACVSVCIFRGRAECVWAQGHMLHADNHVFGGQLCVLFILIWESGLWHHARLSPPSYRQRGSVCMYACFCICCGGAERVRTQGRMLHVDSCILVGSSVLLLLFVCEGHFRTMCDPCPPPPVSIPKVSQCVRVVVFVEVERSPCEHRGACCAVTTGVFLWAAVSFSYLFRCASCRPTSGTGSHLPASVRIA